jgi:hypothetical protein
VVDAVEVAVDLGAQRAAGERVLGAAAQLRGHAVDDRDLPRAGVGAVVVAGPEDGELGPRGPGRRGHGLSVSGYGE